MTTVTPAAATAGTTTPAAPTSAASWTPTTTAVATTICSTVAAARTISGSGTHMRSAFAIKVRFGVWLIGKISPALNHQRARQSRFAVPRRRYARSWRRSFPATHLRALLFQNRLARQPDAVAFHGQHFHQHLIPFLQLVANIGNAML